MFNCPNQREFRIKPLDIRRMQNQFIINPGMHILPICL